MLRLLTGVSWVTCLEIEGSRAEVSGRGGVERGWSHLHLLYFQHSTAWFWSPRAAVTQMGRPGGGKWKQASLCPAASLLGFCQWLWAVPPMISSSPWNQASNLYQIDIVHPRIRCAYTWVWQHIHFYMRSMTICTAISSHVWQLPLKYTFLVDYLWR